MRELSSILGKLFGYGLLVVGVVGAITINVRFGALCLGVGLALKTIFDLPIHWRSRPIEIVAPIAFSLALIALAIALPRSSA